MTAEIILQEGNPGPVNEGERRVLQQFAERLPDGFELHPNLQVAVDRAGLVEVDIIVFGPDCMWIVEVKDLAGDVRVAEHSFVVNGEPRSHPVDSTRLKAQKIKNRLAINPALNDVWIQPLVVLAREPRSLELAETMRKHVMSIDRAAQVLSDPSLIGLHRDRLPSEKRALAKARLTVDASARPARSRFGDYEAVERLAAGGGTTWWLGRHHLLGDEVMLEVLEYDPLVSPSTGSSLHDRQLRAVRVGQVLGAHPNLLAPVTAFVADDGSLVVVHPRSPSPTLESLDVASLDMVAKRRVVQGVALLLSLCGRQGVVHRCIGPSVIHVGPQGQARVTGFGVAKVQKAGAGTVAPEDWSIYGEFWMAPEHLGGDVGHPADLYALGKLIRHLWPEGAPSDLEPLVDSLLSADPSERGPSAADVARVARGEQAVAPAPTSGATIAERYVLGRQLGSGAFANVWSATDVITGNTVAVKIYEAADAGDQVRREYKALENIDHAAVVRVRDITRLDGKWALVTELLEGPDLRAYILDQGPLRAEQALPIVLRLLSGLRSIHPDLDALKATAAAGDGDDLVAEQLAELCGKGVVHRDVKPENVIFVEGRGPVLVDFGMAAGVGGGVSGGTLAYRPPDVAGDGSDPDLDLFAMGVILHELLTGEHPYTDRNPLTGAFAPSDALPGEIAEVVRRSCAPRRAERFGTTAEFIGAVAALGVSDGEVEVPVLGIVERLKSIEDAVAECRWDDALALCDPEWTPVRERIERRRDLAAEAEAAAPILNLHGFSLSSVSSGRFDVASDTGGVDHGPGTVDAYLVSGPAGVMLEVLQYRADDGSVWVVGGDTFQTPMPLARIGRALRLGSQLVDGSVMLELRIAKITNEAGWSNMYKTSLDELVSVTGVDVREMLGRFGGHTIGTREDVIGDSSNRRGELCVVGPTTAEHLPVVAHFITRVLPLAAPNLSTSE